MIYAVREVNRAGQWTAMLAGLSLPAALSRAARIRERAGRPGAAVIYASNDAGMTYDQPVTEG